MENWVRKCYYLCEAAHDGDVDSFVIFFDVGVRQEVKDGVEAPFVTENVDVP